jgi:hypothetical protein
MNCNRVFFKNGRLVHHHSVHYSMRYRDLGVLYSTAVSLPYDTSAGELYTGRAITTVPPPMNRGGVAVSLDLR